jgi:DNA-binding CsgD family transcriptional regulator/sugar-specific transcriptional regulator TrmB
MDILGLDDVTYAVYRVWLRERDLTLEEVADAVGQPVGAVRRARDRLVRLSLLLPSRERPGHLLAVPPQGVLDHLLDQQHEQLLRRSEQLARARAQVTELVADYAKDRSAAVSGEEVERLETGDEVRANTIGLIAGAEREILLLRTGTPIAPDYTEILAAVLRAAQRGVAVRGVHQVPGPLDEPCSASLREAVAGGVDMRVADHPPVGVTVVDGAFGLVLTTPDTPADGALLLRDPALTGLVVSLFEQVWDDAAPWEALEADAVDGYDGAGGAGSAGDPSTQERELLRLLSLGAKDETAARQLGVSVRTVRRMIADLMRELDARSRFQAGVIATQRGWL